MESTYTRGGLRQSMPTPPSPRLLRSRSGTSPATRTCNNSLTSSSQRFKTNRSKSTTRSSRSRNDEENVYPSGIINSSMQKKCKDQCSSNKDGFVRFLQRGSPRNPISDAAKKAKSVTSSPSAWALSPGRSIPYLVAPESPGACAWKVKSSGGVSGVLKYFRQKKVSSVRGEEFHKFRILHNRLLQYKFANARAEASMASLKTAAEGKIFMAWLRVLNIRNLIMEKQIELQKLKHEIKLCQILNPQIRLLNEWSKLEGKNCEAVGRVTRKLSAISVKLPFEDDVKADVKSIYEAMSTATRVMNDIEAAITKFLPQAERILYMLTELTSTVEIEEECLEELDTVVTSVPPLTETEKYLRVHLIQAADRGVEEKLTWIV